MFLLMKKKVASVEKPSLKSWIYLINTVLIVDIHITGMLDVFQTNWMKKNYFVISLSEHLPFKGSGAQLIVGHLHVQLFVVFLLSQTAWTILLNQTL